MLRHSAVSLLTSVVIQLLGLASGIIIARLMGPVGKGELAAIILWPGLIVAIGDLGLYDAIVFFSARNPGREKVLAATAGAIALGLSALLVLAGFVILPFVLGHYGADVVAVSRIYLVWIPLSLLDLSAMAVLQGRLELSAFNWLRLCLSAATVAALLALYAVHSVSLQSIAMAYLAAHGATLIGCLAALYSRGWLGFRPDPRLIRPILTYGAKSNTGNVSALANERADQAVISLFLAPQQLGYYSVAVTLTSVIGLFGTSLALVALPSLGATADVREAHAELGRFVRATWVLAAGVAFITFLLAPKLLALVFGPAFLPATPVAQVLVVAAVVLSTNKVMAAGMKALNMPLAPSIAELLAAGVTVAVLLALLPSLGIMGAGIASLLAYATSFTYMVWMTQRKLGASVAGLLLPSRADRDWLLGRFHGRAAGQGA